MSDKINVLDIEIDELTAKEALKRAIGCMDSDPVSVIEMVTAGGLMQMDERADLKREMESFELVLAGDRTILEAADVGERKYLQETENGTFLKLFIRYLHRNHKRVYLLVESEEESEEFYDYIERVHSGIQIVGMAKVSAENRADDMIVNAVNGGEADCVLAALSAPLREDFIVKNRGLLNTRVFMGMDKEVLPFTKQTPGTGRLSRFILKHIFKKEMEKRKRIREACAAE